MNRTGRTYPLNTRPQGDLSGIFDFVGDALDYWKGKFRRAVGDLKKVWIEFRRREPKLKESRSLVQAAMKHARNDQDRAKLQRLGQRLDAELGEHRTLKAEGDRLWARIKATIGVSDPTLGFIFTVPAFMVGAAAVTAIAGFITTIVLYNKHAAQLERETDLVARGVLTADQVAKIKGGGLLGSLGFNFASLLPIALLGVGAWFAYNKYSQRRRAGA